MRFAAYVIAAGLMASGPAQALFVQNAVPTRRDIGGQLPPATRSGGGNAKVEASIGAPPAPCLLATAPYKDLRFTLHSVHFASLLDEETASLAPLWQSHAGQDIAAPALCEIRDAAAKALNDRGFIAAAEIPAQDVGSGRVTINILFVRIVDLKISGVSASRSRWIRRVLQPLLNGGRFNRFEAERALLLAQDTPGMTSRLILRPTESGPGNVIGDVAVTDKRFSADLSLVNSGADSAGPWGALASVRFHQPLGQGEETSIDLFSSMQPSEQKLLRIAQDVPLNTNGLSLTARWTKVWSSQMFSGLGTKTRTSVIEGGVTAKLIRSLGQNLSATANFEHILQSVDYAGQPFSADRLLFASAALHFDRTFSFGQKDDRPVRWSGDFAVRKGLRKEPNDCNSSLWPCFGVPPSRPESKSLATILSASGAANADVSRSLSLLLALRGQYTSARLPTYELFAGGNYTIGRGFDPGAAAGDKGIGVSFELRHHGFVSDSKAALSLHPFAYADAVKIWQNRSQNLPQELSQSLLSVGGGFRVGYRNARLDLTAAFPVLSRSLSGSTRKQQLLITFAIPIF